METICENVICSQIESNDVFNQEIDSNVLKFDAEMIAWIIVHVFLLLCIVGGNLLTIIAVRICRRLRAVVSNLFILSLAVSDLIVGLTLPFHLSFFLDLGLGKSETLCIFRFCIIIFACCISMWNLISIAIDRYIAIIYPLHYRRFITRRVAVFVIALGWMIGSIIASIPAFQNTWDIATKCEFNEVLPSWYIMGIITPVFCLVWICMLFVYLRIWQEASKQAKQLKTATCCQVLPSDSKSVQVVLLIMGGFSICWLPYFLVASVQIYVMFDACPILYRAALVLAMANSGLNPIVYAWKNSNFRRSFCQLLQCKNPNHTTNSDYSVWEHCPRNGSQQKKNLNTSTPIESRPQSQSLEPTKAGVLNCNPEFKTHIKSPEQFVFSLPDGQHKLKDCEIIVPTKIFYSPCEVCKILKAAKLNPKKNSSEFIMPWNCEEYNHHNTINTMKSRW